MSSKSFSDWCKSVLPANYQATSSLTRQYQRFIQENLPAELVDSVSVINADARQIVIAASSGQIANYLRLHVQELTQQFREVFGGDRTIRIRAMPASLTQIDLQRHKLRPLPVSEVAIDNIDASLDWIDDENLRKALQSLSNQLKKSKE